jgi:hypothetical protein
MTIEVTAAAKDNSTVARNRIMVVRPVINHKDDTAMTIAMMRKNDPDARIAGLATTQTVLAQLIVAMKVIARTTAADHGLTNVTGTTGATEMRAAMIECRTDTQTNVIATMATTMKKTAMVECQMITAASVKPTDDMVLKIGLDKRRAVIHNATTIQPDSGQAGHMVHMTLTDKQAAVTATGTVKAMLVNGNMKGATAPVKNEAGGIARQTKSHHGLAIKRQSAEDRWIDNVQNCAAVDPRITGALTNELKKTSVIAWAMVTLMLPTLKSQCRMQKLH